MSIFSPLFSVRSKSSKSKKHTFSRSRSLRLESLEDRALLAVVPAGELTALQTYYPDIDWSNANSYDYYRIDLATIPSATAATHAADMKTLIGSTANRDLIVFNTAGLAPDYVLQLEAAISFAGGHSANSAILVSLNIAGDGNHTYSPFTVKAASGNRIGTFTGEHYVAFGGINFQGTGTVAANGGAFSQTSASSSVTFDHVSFTDFSVSNPNQGGAFYAGNGVSEFSNTLFVGNSAAIGGAIYAGSTYTTTTIDFSTFSGNTARAGQGGGAYLGNDATVKNSIFHGNTGSTPGADLVLGTSSTQSNLYVGNGNYVDNSYIYGESPFVGGGSYQLSPTSRAIGAAGSTTVALDLAGNPRVQRDTADLGAFESSYTDGRYNTYIGANGGYWNVATNWDRGYVPTADETAYIPTGRTVHVTSYSQDEVVAFLLEDPTWNIDSSKDYVGAVLNYGTIATEKLDSDHDNIAFVGAVTNGSDAGSGTIIVDADITLLLQDGYQQKGDLQLYGSVGFQGEANFLTSTIVTYLGAEFFASDGGIVNVSADSTFTVAEGVKIAALSGATLNLGGLKTLTDSANIEAGEDSVITLPSLNTVTIAVEKELYVKAVDGGVVTLSDRLTAIGGDGNLVLDSGADSVINIRSLYFRRDITLTELGTGEINIPDLDTTHVVTVGDDVIYGEVHGSLSLREAVALAAVDGKTITFANYYGTSDAIFGDTIALTEGEILIATNATITGLGAASLSIEAAENSRIFNIATGTTISMSGLTLTGGNTADRGGAIRSYGNLTLENMVFTGNESAMDGGAIRQDYGSLTLTNVDFDNNTASYGGGVYVFFGTLNVEGGTFQENSAAYGGAVYLRQVTNADFNGVDFFGNTALYDGGAVYQFNGNMTVSVGEFGGNDARYGGAIYVSDTTSLNTIAGTQFSDNTATSQGGAIYFANGTLSASGATFEGNAAGERGGAIAQNGGELSVDASQFLENGVNERKSINTIRGGAVSIVNTSTATFSGVDFESNSSMTDGGAIYQYGANTELELLDVTTFLGNKAAQGAALYVNTAGSLLIEGGEFTENIAGYEGGAIYFRNTLDAIISEDTAFIGNTAGERGGAIFQRDGLLKITDAIFEENESFGQDVVNSGGGAIFLYSGELEVTDSGFTSNTANNESTGIFKGAGGKLTLSPSVDTDLYDFTLKVLLDDSDFLNW